MVASSASDVVCDTSPVITWYAYANVKNFFLYLIPKRD